jgi:hypothetical protein
MARAAAGALSRIFRGVGSGAAVLAFEAMAWGRTVATFALGVMSLAAACATLSSAPLGSGDRVIVDVDATTLPPQPTQNVPPDSPFAPVDGSRGYGPEYDAYALLTVCSSNLVPDASAEGAGPPAPSRGSDAEALRDGEAVSDAPSYAGAASASAGCEPLPAACANEPDCECLLRVLAAKIPCPYPHCSVDNGFKMYCP